MPISRNCRARSETKLRWPHGTEYLLARACKDHDCADNNTVLLYSAAQGVVYGKANRQRRSTLIGVAARGGQRIGSFVAGRMAAESITNGAISDAKCSQAYLKFSDDEGAEHVLSHFVCIGSCSKATDFIISRAAKFQDSCVVEV
jgi:Inhibitor of vertebrate lysozyme (Ivy)